MQAMDAAYLDHINQPDKPDQPKEDDKGG